MAKKKKRRLKKKYRILRGIYIAVVVIAAIIVIAYAALKFTVRALLSRPGQRQCGRHHAGDL